MIKMIVATSLLAVVMCGCVGSSEVVQVGDEKYFVTAKDKGGVFSEDGKVVAEATQKAKAYCQQRGKEAVIDEIKRDPEGPMRFETSDVYFSCK
jgi:uncharacterized lipoprotein NlpE involved in copper resistance